MCYTALCARRVEKRGETEKGSDRKEPSDCSLVMTARADHVAAFCFHGIGGCRETLSLWELAVI